MRENAKYSHCYSGFLAVHDTVPFGHSEIYLFRVHLLSPTTGESYHHFDVLSKKGHTGVRQYTIHFLFFVFSSEFEPLTSDAV